MSEPYYRDSQLTLWHGDAIATLAELEDASAHMCVTSPPYYGLRDYHVPGQYGEEPTWPEYVEHMRAVFHEVRRVLVPEGTLWLNLGDTYSDKQLLGIPWRVAFALVDDGWLLRNELIWHKRRPLPESMADRFSRTHEHVHLFASQPSYYMNLGPLRQETYREQKYPVRRVGVGYQRPEGRIVSQAELGEGNFRSLPDGKNPGTVWRLPQGTGKREHFAVMPVVLAERAIIVGCPEGGTVLDPFSGSGTSGLAATKLGCKYVGIDLNEKYLRASLRDRLAQPGIEFA